MPTQRGLWLWSVVALITTGCQDEPVDLKVRDFSPTMNADAPSPDAAVGRPPDGATTESPPATGPVEKCRPAMGQAGPARTQLMQEGAGPSAPEVSVNTMTVEQLYEGFDKLCSACHGNPAAKMGNLLVRGLDDFKLSVGQDSLDRIKTTDRALAMPKDNKLLSERAAANPKDGVVVLALRLEAWLKANKASTFPDPTSSPSTPTDNAPVFTNGQPYALSKSLGSSLTNMGSCIPAREVVSSDVEPMNKLDAKFASILKFQDLPTKLSETDLFTLDSQLLAQQGVISFAPGYTLWADDAHKMRYVRVPRGESIKFVIATQSFDIPDNTRFYKTFLKEVKDKSGNVGYRKMETRLIIARKSVEKPGSDLPEIKAVYATYQWNADETEATLLAEPYKDGTDFADRIIEYVKDEAIDEALTAKMDRYADPFAEGAKRHYALPGADRCVQCHLGQPSFVLGFLPLQIRRRPVGEGGVVEPAEPDELNQLERFIDYGLVTGITKAEIARKILPLEKSQGERNPRNEHELAAQGYMLGNCAHCHNPNGYTSRTAPLLKTVLNFLPSPDGGGIFQFPLDRVSPRIKRSLPQVDNPKLDVKSAEKDTAQAVVVEMPYITPSRYDVGSGPLSPYDWRSTVPSYVDPTNTRVYTPPTLAPWRSLIFRNVHSGFTYSDNTTIFPHMPQSTAGHDCRAPKLLGEWMLSIPSIDYEFEKDTVRLERDNRPQPYVEVPVGHPRYAEALKAAQQRVVDFANDPAVTECSNAADIIDANAASLDPVLWDASVLTPTSSEWPRRIPERAHWVSLDNRVALSTTWEPRNQSWKQSLVDGMVPPPADPTPENVAKQEEQALLLPILQRSRWDAELKRFALEEVPFGFWQKKPECKLEGVKKASSYAPDPRWTWLDRVKDREQPVYSQAPGAAIFGMICINCHGASFEANGRQANVVVEITGGRVTVANFRDGLFGPRTSPGAGRQSVFTTPGVDSPDDWAARYLAWMALGGTLKPIPPAVLQVVGDTPVLGKTISRGAAASANMLEVAKVVCAAVLPTAAQAGYATKKYSREIGDYDLWRRVCAFRNQVPVREISVDSDTILKVSIERDAVHEEVRLYRRDSPAYLPGTQFWDLYDGTMKTGVGQGVVEPECLAPKVNGSLGPAESQRAFDAAYEAARARNTPGLRPVCPGSSLVQQPGAPLPEKTPLTVEEQNSWALQGAVNAGFAVFSYVDAVTRNQVPVQLAYDQCEQLKANGQP